MKSKAKVKGDFILIVVIILLGLVALVYNQVVVPKGDLGTKVFVEIEGRVVDVFDLATDLAPRRIDTKHGFNVIEIVEGQVRVAGADCPDLLCVHTGWRQHAGQVIVCLPHYFVLRIVGDHEDQGSLDGFTY